MRGFTLIEILITISIVLILSVSAIFSLGKWQKSSQLSESSIQIIQSLTIARQASLSGYNNSNHGVFFEINNGAKDKFILYQGQSYATRNPIYDQQTILDSALSLYSTDLNFINNDIDINFSSIGQASNTGTLMIIHTESGNRSIIINNLGIAHEI